MSEDKTAWCSSVQHQIECYAGGGSTALSSQLYLSITTETQFLLQVFHCPPRWACQLFAGLPGFPITSMLGPCHGKVVLKPRFIHQLHPVLTVRTLLSLKLLDKPKKMKRRERGGETEEEMKKDWKLPGGRFGQRTGKERTVWHHETCQLL